MIIKKFNQINESTTDDKELMTYLEELTQKLETSIVDINKNEGSEKKLEKIELFLDLAWDLRNLMEDINAEKNQIN